MDQETLSRDSIKFALTSTDSLSHYDPQFPLSLACDASSVGVGAVIFHTLPNGTEKVVAYASRKLSLAKKSMPKFSKKSYPLFMVSKSSASICWVESSVC